jgi:recombination protein U
MTSHANRGKPLEELIISANEVYREKHIATVEKVPTEWIPLRNRKTHRIASAKVDHKAIVDFLGNYMARPIAFDAKLVTTTASQKGDRVYLREIDDNQAKFLQYWTHDGSPGFVLVSFNLRQFFVITWQYWRGRSIAARAKDGPASLTLDTLVHESQSGPYPRNVAEVRQSLTNPLDYLHGVYDLFFDRLLSSGRAVW